MVGGLLYPQLMSGRMDSLRSFPRARLAIFLWSFDFDFFLNTHGGASSLHAAVSPTFSSLFFLSDEAPRGARIMFFFLFPIIINSKQPSR